MTNKELTQLINKNESVEFLKSVKINLEFENNSTPIEIIGIQELYIYIQKQKDGWNLIEGPFPDLFEYSRLYFNEFRKHIESLIKAKNAKLVWKELIFDKFIDYKNYGYNNEDKIIFTYNSPLTSFLLQTYTIAEETFNGAYDYLFETLAYNSFDNKNYMKGIHLAFDFERIDESISRISNEKKSFNQLRTNYDKLLVKTEQQFSDTKNTIATWFKNSEQQHSKQFEKQASDFENQHHKNQTKVSDLEKLYSDKLMLSKPAEYWGQRAETLKKDANKWIIWLGVAILLAVALLLIIILNISNETIIQLFSNLSSGIKWSIVFISIISFLAFAIKTFSKLAFSAYHLARDAEERRQLVYVYLSLLNENAIADKERIIILQSLFSRSETGLLKEESSPTMPSASILEKAISKP